MTFTLLSPFIEAKKDKKQGSSLHSFGPARIKRRLFK